jgi:hypothetical protein
MAKSLTRFLSAFDELTWCVYCASFVLLGNCWNVLIGAPAKVTLVYAAVSGAFASISLVTAMCRRVLRTRPK